MIFHQGRYEEAEKLHREVLEVRRRMLGPDAPTTLVSVACLARVLNEQGRHEEAIELLTQLSGPRKRQASDFSVDPFAQEALASAYDRIAADVLMDLKQWDEMHRYWESAMEIREQTGS